MTSFLDGIPILFRCLFQLVGTVFIILGSHQVIRQVLLLNPVVGVVVGIQVTLIPLHRIRVGMHILQMPGKIPALTLFYIRQGSIQGNVSRVGFGGSCHENGCISQGNPGFRHPRRH